MTSNSCHPTVCLAFLPESYVEQSMSALNGLIGEVEAALAAHQKGEAAPFSSAMLKKVLSELNLMRNSGTFVPTYPRFALDWPDASSDLGKALMSAVYVRGEALKRKR